MTNPANAQNLNDLLRIFGADNQQVPKQAQTEWRRLPPAEMSCIDQRLRHQGSSVEALIRGGVKPSAARLVELRSSCREFVHRLQNGSVPALARDANGSQRATIAARSPTEPKDVNVTSSAEPKYSGMAAIAEPSKNSAVAFSGEPSKDSDMAFSEPPEDSEVAPSAEPPKDSEVTPLAKSPKEPDVTPSVESPKDSEVTPPAESPKGSSAALSSEQSVGRGAEELVQQVNLEPKSSVPERGIKESQSAALLFAVAGIALLLVIVIALFNKWRKTMQGTAGGHT
jgi:hypothetical protein